MNLPVTRVVGGQGWHPEAYKQVYNPNIQPQ